MWASSIPSFRSELPHGGVKKSGCSKHLSTYVLDDYTRVEHAMINLD